MSHPGDVCHISHLTRGADRASIGFDHLSGSGDQPHVQLCPRHLARAFLPWGEWSKL